MNPNCEDNRSFIQLYVTQNDGENPPGAILRGGGMISLGDLTVYTVCMSVSVCV